MAFRGLQKIPCALNETLQDNANSCLIIIRFLATKAGKTAKAAKRSTEVDPCPSRACNQKKKSFWRRLFEYQETKRPPVECCKVKYYTEDKIDPDLSRFGGTAYRTCGRGYVIQKDMLPEGSEAITAEEKIVRKIETHPQLKELLEDPLPKFHNVSERMIEINDRKLHPLYNKIRQTPRLPCPYDKRPVTEYVSYSGPIDINEIPAIIKFDKEILEKKNLYAEYKRVEPPRALIGRMVEMKRNEKPLLGSKVVPKKIPKRVEEQTKKCVYDTLSKNTTLL